MGDEPPASCSTSSGRGYFEPTPCSRVERLTYLVSEGAAAEPPLSAITSGMATDPPTPVGSWGATSEPPPSAGTLGAAVGPPASIGPEDGPTVRPISTGLEGSLPPRVEREGSLRGWVGTCQRILALQDTPIHAGDCLIKLVVVVIVVIVVTACLLSLISCLLLL